MTLTRKEAIAIARKAAHANPEMHGYIVDGFVPHEWVVDAILAAANPPFVPETPGRVQELLRIAMEYGTLNLNESAALDPNMLFPEEMVSDEEVKWFADNYIFDIRIVPRET